MIKNIDFFGDKNRNKSRNRNPTDLVKTMELSKGTFYLTIGFYENCKRALHAKLPMKQFLYCVYDVEDDDDLTRITNELYSFS